MHSQSEEEYKLLSPGDEDVFEDIPGKVMRRRRLAARDLVLVTQTLILLLVLIAWLWSSRREFSLERCQVLYCAYKHYLLTSVEI